MGTTIYYFSGTGNSLFAAKELSSLIEDSKIEPIAKLINNENIKSESKKIGFVFPLYYWGLPKIVFDFIKKIDLAASKYFFYILTSGGANGPDGAAETISGLLKDKGKALNYGARVVMPDNYIKLLEPDSFALQKSKNENSKIELIEIAKDICIDKNKINKKITGYVSIAVNKLWKMKVNKSDNSFFYTDLCNSCGICKKVCPVNNISLNCGKPQWNNKCEECLACLHFCPKESIQTKRTSKRARYHHPEITLQEIIAQKA